MDKLREELTGLLYRKGQNMTRLGAGHMADAILPIIQRELDAAKARNAKLADAARELVERYVTEVDPCRVGGFYFNPEKEDVVINVLAALENCYEEKESNS